MPISSDIASHIMEKQHTRFTTIEDVMTSLKKKSFLSLPNISFSKKWNRKVRETLQYNQCDNTIPQVIKDWRVSMNSVLDNIENGGGGSTSIQFQYEKPRKCLHPACQFEAEDPADMFKHIRQQHVKSNN